MEVLAKHHVTIDVSVPEVVAQPHVFSARAEQISYRDEDGGSWSQGTDVNCGWR
jgi:hypothetical protein